MTFDELKADFDLIDSWEDRFRYVMDLGRALEPLPDDARTDDNKVRGCASQVWLVSEHAGTARDGSQKLHFKGDSDALLVKGLVAVLFELINDRSAREISGLDLEGAFAQLGLKEHLTPQRSNGLVSMVARVKKDAAAAIG